MGWLPIVNCTVKHLIGGSVRLSASAAGVGCLYRGLAIAPDSVPRRGASVPHQQGGRHTGAKRFTEPCVASYLYESRGHRAGGVVTHCTRGLYPYAR